jgi:hypothetical protein
VAIGADFDFEHVAFDGRAGGEIVAAGAMDCYGVIIGMNTGFHEAPFVRVRSARLSVVRGKSLTLEVVSYSRVARSRGTSIIREVGSFSKYRQKAGANLGEGCGSTGTYPLWS